MLTASAGTDSDIILFLKSWREEFAGREFDVLKYFARIISCCNTFFSGNAEIISGNKHLNSAFKLNNGEKTESDENFSSARRNDEISVEAICNAFREVEFTSAAVTFAAFGNSA